MRARSGGFTLIEISIVLVIIGLITGGILVGRDLIETAQTRALISQLEEYQRSVNAFQLKYGSLPGDIGQDKALSFGFMGHDDTAQQYHSGNEDGLIDDCTGNPNFSEAGCEMILFWRDLSDAEMINVGLDAATDDIKFNLSAADMYGYFPAAKGVDGGLILVEAQIAPSHNSLPVANFLIVAATNGTDGTGRVSTKVALSPMKTFSIDQKLDDGWPTSGIVQGWKPQLNNFFLIQPGANNCHPFTPPGAQAIYNLDDERFRDKPLCVLLKPL